MTTGFVWDEKFAWHEIGFGAGPLLARGWIEPGQPHVDDSAAKRRIRNLIDASGLLKQLVAIDAKPASEDQLLSIHTPGYLAKVRELSDSNGGDLGPDAWARTGTFEVAALAAGGLIAAVDAVMAGSVTNAYALIRPAGHHSTASEGAGFCVFANVAIAVKHLKRTHAVPRVAVVDWDAHHGNGTQAAFYDDPSVLTISIHQDGVFPPGSGSINEIGADAGIGFNINVPLPPGSGTGAYQETFRQIVIPALERFRPDFILVANGFDANNFDPLSRQLLSSDDFRWMTRELREFAEDSCGQRLVLSQEGGYHTGVVPFCGLAVAEELSGIKTSVVDPFVAMTGGTAWQSLLPHQADAISRARVAARLLS